MEAQTRTKHRRIGKSIEIALAARMPSLAAQLAVALLAIPALSLASGATAVSGVPLSSGLEGGATPPGPGGASQQPGAPPVPVEPQGKLWETVELPVGFVLDLLSGLVTSRPEGERPTLEYTRGRLGSRSPLRRLPPSLAAPRARIERDGGEAVSGVTPEVGQELVFDCFDAAWGYLRVLDVTPEAVTLEYLLETDLEQRELLRAPAALTASSGPEGVTLTWPADPGALYRVERRRLPGAPGEPAGRWESLGEVGDGSFRDDLVALKWLSEYRVALVGDAGGFGSSALGAAGLEPPGIRAEVEPGTDLNLLSATSDELRVDLTVQYVRSNGVQIKPGEGVEARNLTPEEERGWVLPEIEPDGYSNQLFFVQAGRVLALRLPEGVHAMLRVEELRSSSVVLSRQVDLTGERLFPPPPAEPTASWEPGRGVVFTFPEPEGLPPVGEPLLVVERERTLDAGDWVRCAIGEPGQRELLDRDVGEELLVRYRFRQGLTIAQLSLSSAPLTVLAGGDSDDARAALLERAILDLGSEDYDRRGRARAVLRALGEGAWPLLREALRSQNPELAESARELLLRGLREAGEADAELSGGLARLLLTIRAEELGYEAPPHPDWTAPEPGARASAALRGLGWRSSTDARVAAWRRVLSEADPDEAVQRVAALAELLEAEGLGPDLAPVFPSLIDEPEGGDVWSADPWTDPSGAGRAEDPWARLVALQAAHELAAHRDASSTEFELAVEHEQLARYLIQHYTRNGDALFLDAALRTIEDPRARLRGALDLARSRRREGFSSSGAPPRVARLETPDGEQLFAAIDALAESGESGVELVLPAGIYVAPEGERQLTLEGLDLRLRGEGEVELRFGLSVLQGSRLVLENVTLAPAIGMGLNVVSSELVLRDGQVRGGNVGLLGTDAVVELERSTIVSPRSAGSNAGGIRFGGRSILLAAESRIESPGVAIYGARAALLDRCVVVSTGRQAIEGSTGADLWAVASLIRSQKTPFLRIERGLLEGVVLVDGVDNPFTGAPGLRACAEHLHGDSDPAGIPAEAWIDGCALGR